VLYFRRKYIRCGPVVRRRRAVAGRRLHLLLTDLRYRSSAGQWLAVWHSGSVVRRVKMQLAYSTSSPVSTGMGDRLLGWYCTPTRHVTDR